MKRNHYLQSLELNKLDELASFIVDENYSHHADGELPENYSTEVEEIHQEELQFFQDSQIFVARDYLGEIFGSIRVVKWNYEEELPIKKIFGICPSVLDDKEESRPIWHIGRFAIKKEYNNLNLFKKLMVHAIAPVCENKESISIAECDSKLLRVLRMLGIEAKSLAEPVDYLGSETIPISMSYEGLIGFYNKYKHLNSNLRLDSTE